VELIEQKMYQDKLNLAKLAETLGIGKPKLLEILTGKRKPDVPFIKTLYKNLNIDRAFLLDPV
jgi:HTH-type transcriptional regulator / antitoxin HigA